MLNCYLLKISPAQSLFSHGAMNLIPVMTGHNPPEALPGAPGASPVPLCHVKQLSCCSGGHLTCNLNPPERCDNSLNYLMLWMFITQ